MHCERIAVGGNIFPGLFARANDEIALVGHTAGRLHSALARVLKVRLIVTTVADSNLPGIYAALNSNGAVLPQLCSEKEKDALKREGLNVEVLKGRYNAAGNNIAANDKGAVANPRMSRSEAGRISECLGVEVVQRTIAGFSTVGSACVVTSKGFLASNNASEEELRELECIFRVKGSIGTANMGVPFPGPCLVANAHGYLVGERTSGFEMARIDEALAFV